MIASGVFAGASMPTIDTDSYPGTPDSATVGTPGNNADRSELVTARAFALPDLTKGPPEPDEGNTSCTSPPSRAFMPGTLPLYGTPTILIPVMLMNSSAVR